MNYLYRIATLTFIIGALACAYRNQWIIFRLPWHTTPALQPLGADKKKVIISHYTPHGFVSEAQQMLWQEQCALNAQRLINAYLTIVYEENCIDKKVQLQGASTTSTNQELLLNFSHAPLPEDASLYEKWMLLEGLLKTVREQIPQIKTVRFLVNHKPLMDHHLDFSRPWPIEGFLPGGAPAQAPHTPHTYRDELFTMMLEPAGDAQYTGRIIDDAFERGITLQCAQALKKVIEATALQTRVILSRFPGEVLEPLQNAAFANRLQTNLYVAISIYQLSPTATKQDRPAEVNIYYCLYHPTTDFWQRAHTALVCEPYHHAHVGASAQSQAIAQGLFTTLHNTKPFAGKLIHLGGLPIKPLIGITAPAILIELGLPHKDDWKQLIPQLAQQLMQTVDIV